MAVSFATNILPMFRPIDIQHMKRHKVKLDDYAYMSDATGDDTYADHAHARNVLDNLSPHAPNPPAMPPGGPYWSPAQLTLYDQWMTDGFLP
jgi:hypothetical protein